MEVALSAFLGEIVQRSISFFLDRLSKEATASGLLPSDEALRCKLLRVHIVVEEAEGRQIRNHAMLEQLKVLQTGMYRGYYVLDMYRAYQADNIQEAVSHSFAFSKFNPAKRVQLCGGGSASGPGERELKEAIGSLEIIITDASEFAMFLNRSSPLYRPVYSTHLVMEKCMFNRHVEMEHIVNFLMEKGSHSTEDLDVLPIVGPAKAGKSTLIKHACNDERVLTAFSRIVSLTEDGLNENVTFARDAGKVRHQSHDSNRDERVLVIFEVNGDIDDATWSKLRLHPKRYAANGGKIIICSRSHEIVRFGTTRVLRVEYLTPEAYWYFFKALAFGSTNPDEKPKLTSMAMEIAAGLNGSFIAGNVMARMLRANFSVRFWRMALSCAREVNKRYHFMFGAHPVSPLQNRKLVQILNGSNDYCVVFKDYQVLSVRDEAPMITFQEVLLGNVEHHGKFDVVAWRSSIPPYYTYLFSCEIHKSPQLDVSKKHISSMAA